MMWYHFPHKITINIIFLIPIICQKMGTGVRAGHAAALSRFLLTFIPEVCKLIAI